MPFEYHKDRKSLTNGDDSFQNMCDAGRWTGFIDVFMVNTTEHPHDLEAHEPCEEEIRVERNVASFVDDDPDFDYHDTPPNSGGEDEYEDKFVRFRKGSGKLQLNQVFETIKEFKEALVEYALKKGYNIMNNTYGKVKSGVVCSIPGCSWRIYLS